MKSKKICIIGGSGGIGQVFTRLFKKYHYEIVLMARNKEKLEHIANDLKVNYELDIVKSVKDADIVIVSVPISTTKEILKQVAPHLKRGALLCDVTSLKSDIASVYEEISEKYPIQCVSLHPMFGPGIKKLENYVIILLKLDNSSEYNKTIDELKQLFCDEGLIVQELTNPQYHDKIMALVLALPHMFNILFLDFLKRVGIPLSELTKFTGTTFLLQKVFAESIIQREVEMFGDIQMDNKEFVNYLEIFETQVNNYKEIISTHDMDGFKQIFKDGLNFSKEDKHFRKSYDFFYQFMKVLKSE